MSSNGQRKRSEKLDGERPYGNPDMYLEANKESLHPYLLITYTLKGLSPKDKMALQRGLFGYRTLRRYGKKKYLNSSTGLVGDKGKRIGPTIFMLKDSEMNDVRGLFRKCRCRFEEIPIWLEEKIHT
jgi:hypothetical protein